LNSKFFARRFIGRRDYLLPLTIELLSAGQDHPLGIRVSAYEPAKCLNTGLFIFVNFDYWKKKKEEEPS
jgi:hypothetical protein